MISAIKPCWLVVSTPLKNISQLGLLFPYIMKKKCSKPPTSDYFKAEPGFQPP
jgi:hypothetical protein